MEKQGQAQTKEHGTRPGELELGGTTTMTGTTGPPVRTGTTIIPQRLSDRERYLYPGTR